MSSIESNLAARLQSCKCECVIDHVRDKVVKQCPRCKGLAEYAAWQLAEARKAIIQEPGKPQR